MLMNEIKLKGRVYRYETKQTSTGKTLCRFGLQFYTGKDKDGKSKYAFVNCKGFADYGLKEKQDVFVSGNLACEEWTDKEGNKRSALLILASSVGTEEPKEEKGFEFGWEENR